MSRFKRYQSKVFWGQMESQDLGGALCSPSPKRAQVARERGSEDARQDEEVAMSVEAEEENRESDTTDAENTTVIHIELCQDTPTRG